MTRAAVCSQRALKMLRNAVKSKEEELEYDKKQFLVALNRRGESYSRCTPLSLSVSIPIGMERGCQQSGT